jgi:hypothetical protein
MRRLTISCLRRVEVVLEASSDWESDTGRYRSPAPRTRASSRRGRASRSPPRTGAGVLRRLPLVRARNSLQHSMFERSGRPGTSPHGPCTADTPLGHRPVGRQPAELSVAADPRAASGRCSTRRPRGRRLVAGPGLRTVLRPGRILGLLSSTGRDPRAATVRPDTPAGTRVEFAVDADAVGTGAHPRLR